MELESTRITIVPGDVINGWLIEEAKLRDHPLRVRVFEAVCSACGERALVAESVVVQGSMPACTRTTR